MLVHFPSKVCFLGTPKTASQALAQVLRSESGFVTVSDHHSGWDDPNPSGRVANPEAARLWEWANPATFAYFFVIRNPFDVLASWFELSKAFISYPQIGPEWFEAWKAKERSFPREGLYRFLREKPPGPTAVVRYEDFPRDVRTLARLFGFNAPRSFPRVGETPGRKPWRSYYDDENRRWVEHAFALELEVGRWGFDK